MKKLTLLLSVLFCCSQLVSAQQRYVDEIYTDADIVVEENVLYGVNATVLALAVYGEAVPQPLAADIYHASNADIADEADRPLVIIAHTGNFLPPTFNGGCGGTKSDYDVVELAKRLARMGYVAAAIDYRLGWDPANSDQTTRVTTLINAAYRGMQDIRTAVKYFRLTTTDFNDPYGIDADKITLWGFGTGGYITNGAATLNAVQDTWIPKFTTPFGPMVVESINGGVNAATVGIAPEGYPGFPAGDTLCYANHIGVDASFKLAVAQGGALGDTSWIDAADVPMIYYQVPTDPFAPCGIGIVNVPPPVNLPVVEVMGACVTMPIFNDLGINDVMEDNYIDPISIKAAELNGNIHGSYLFYSDDPTESAPWNATGSIEPYGVAGSDCPGTAADQADAAIYMDTVIQYFIPRACKVLGLNCGDLSTYIDVTNTDELTTAEVGLSVVPNPAVNEVRFNTATEMEHIYIYNTVGTLVATHENVHNTQYTINRDGLATGLYVAMIKFENGYTAQKIMFE